MWRTAVLALTLGIAKVCPGLTIPDAYEHGELLEGSETDMKYALFWKSNKTHVTFEVRVKTTGWVGFGISSSGNMFPADVVIGWVDYDGIVHLADRHTMGYVKPEVDKSQDWHLLYGKEKDSWTVLTFLRAVNTCDDANDEIITQGTIRVIYAYGNSDPVSGDVIVYHGLSRGTRSMDLLTAVNVPANLPEDVNIYEFVNQNDVIPASVSTYWCRGFKMRDIGGKHHVIKFEAIITPGNEQMVHHIVLYRCQASNPELIDGVAGNCHIDRPKQLPYCTIVIVPSAVGSKPFYFPEHVGLAVGDTSDVFYVLQTHFENPRLLNGVRDSSGIRLTMTPTVRPNEAAMLDMGYMNTNMIVPPYQEDYTVKGYCSKNCIKDGMDAAHLSELRVFSVMHHSHLLGTAMTTRHFRNGEEIEPLLAERHYDFYFQTFHSLPEERVVQPGDSFRVDCTYDSSSRSSGTYGGFGTQEEMCRSSVYYYPRIPAVHCLSKALYDNLNFQNHNNEKPVFRTKSLLLLLVLLGLNVAKPSNPGPDLDQPGGGAGEALNGVPEDNGHLSGVAQQAILEHQDAHMEWEEQLDGDQHMEEMRIQDAEIDFLEWVEEFREIGEAPNITQVVKGYMSDNNMTIEDVKRSYGVQSGATNRKRSAAITKAGIWNKCIIPYTFSDTIPEENKKAAIDVMKLFEKETGFRFYPKDKFAESGIDLGHTNYLIFLKNSGCNAGLGNKMNPTGGQGISACTSVGTAIHELVHTFGLGHEHAAAGNWPFLDVHYKESSSVFTHTRWNIGKMYQDSKSYDPASIMHYGSWGVRNDYIYTFFALDPDFEYLLHHRENIYYVLKAVQEYNKCYDEYPSCSPLPVCEWDGYPSVIDGKCQCKCPEGLDPATGCSTVKQTLPPPAWPKGKYSFLKTNVDPCPEGFATGTMYNNQDSYLWNSDKYHFDKHNPDEYAHNVCTKTEEGTGDPWPAGQYCILRYGGTCPEGFQYGLAETYGEVPTRQDMGTVPDGEHGQLFEYIFCCRNDGDVTEPMALPIESAFILYLGEANDCQEVAGMYFVEEKYYMRSDYDAYKIKRVGSLPNMYIYSNSLQYIYFCAYFPKAQVDCSVTKTLDGNEKTYTFTTPNFPNNYPQNAKCSWYIKSPEGSRMQLDFTKFEVAHATDTDCDSHVSVKAFRPGSPGFKFCGRNYPKTRWTYMNYLIVDFVSDGSTTQTGFSATVRVFTEEDKCYKGDGRDRSYAGKLTYDKDFNNCLPWSQVTSCPFHQFDSRFADNDLAENNYCRNIGIAGQPWCYTNLERCSRQICDACMTGSCYDLFDDCEALIAADSNYCSSNKYGEASRGCRKSCGGCAKHVEIPAGATCGAPPVVKGVTATPAAESYKVGDVITYKCRTGTDWRESVCTSEGKWTPLNFICGACPSGWASWKGKCYKYLDWDTNVDYPTALSLCEKLNARLMQVDSKEKHTYFESLVDYYPEPQGLAWIGLTKDDNGEWAWLDGSPLSWTWWDRGEPDDNDEEKCVRTGDDGDWNDVLCTDKANVVCEYTPTGPFSCEDQISNCEAVIRSKPDVCSTYPDYAWANCRKSCAVGDCSSTVTCNDDTNIGDTGRRTTGADTINVGQTVTYECAEGYYHISGDLTRGCLPSGSLTGSAPVCSNDDGLEIELFDNQPHKDFSARNHLFSGPYTYLTAKGGMTFPKAGKVTSWTFYSHLKGGEVAFEIYRPSTDPKKVHDDIFPAEKMMSPSPAARDDITFSAGNISSCTLARNRITNIITGNMTLTYIGKNHVSSLPDLRIHTAQIPEAEQVAVQKGDVYGIWVKGKQMSFDNCKNEELHKNDFVGWVWSSGGSKVGQEYTFKTGGDWCRVIGVKATFKLGG